MIGDYFEASERLSQLAEEYSIDNELANILRANSAKIAKMAANKGAIIKEASAVNGPDEK